MADRPLFTNESALTGADVIAKSIADSGAVPPLVGAVRLFDSTLVPDNGTTLAILEAAEIVLTGYPVGGYDITDFIDAVFAPLGGAVVTSNLINVAYASGAAALCGGYWVETGTSPANKVREVFIYDPPRNLAVVGDGWPIVVQLGYGSNFGV